MPQATPQRFNAASIVALLLTILLGAGHDSVIAANNSPQVSLTMWIVLGSEDFKRQLQSTDGVTVPADESAIQALLEEAARNGEAELLAQARAATAERVVANLAKDLPVPFESVGQGSELIKIVRVELAMTPQSLNAENVALNVKLTTKLATPASAGVTEILTSDSRTLRRSALLAAGRTLILSAPLANPDSLQLAKKQGKPRELLILITPQVFGSVER